MIIVVAAVYVQRSLGNRATADIQYIGQALADSCVERFVHVGDALGGGEIGRAQTGHRHAGRDRSGCVLAFGLDENQRASGCIDVPFSGLLRPVLAHLRRRCNRVGAGRIGRFALAHDDGTVAIHRHADTGILECLGLLFVCHDSGPDAIFSLSIANAAVQ